MRTPLSFAQDSGTFANSVAPLRDKPFYPLEPGPEYLPLLRYQVVLAGKNFFHIKETTTGRVRGFRRNHNDACALAKTLENNS
ncbi:hypothetical protein [Pseudomonas fluorescens]|uniref:Uncharacterized protein n=1 Tax=Pseudomonas fluorescens TaxID=294 RepID=A0A5E7ECR5_PSEFL|nr:hypothetical protein [Pseudomonas fluorescens]VVO24781.1 hypothetical protein PS691_04469 [Pseudomonas fluorescens]